jgi:hypothetical protein
VIEEINTKYFHLKQEHEKREALLMSGIEKLEERMDYFKSSLHEST